MSLLHGRAPLNGTVYVTNQMRAGGEHVITHGTTGLATMVRIAKREQMELWGITPAWRTHTADNDAPLTPHLFWLVEVEQHADYFAGHIRDVALIYPGDYQAMQAFMQPLRTARNLARAVGASYPAC